MYAYDGDQAPGDAKVENSGSLQNVLFNNISSIIDTNSELLKHVLGEQPTPAAPK